MTERGPAFYLDDCAGIIRRTAKGPDAAADLVIADKLDRMVDYIVVTGGEIPPPPSRGVPNQQAEP